MDDNDNNERDPLMNHHENGNSINHIDDYHPHSIVASPPRRYFNHKLI